MLCRHIVSVISTPCTVLQGEYCNYFSGEHNLDGRVESPWAHLLSWTYQNHHWLQDSHQWKRLEPTRKDLLQLKSQRRHHSEEARSQGLVLQSNPISPSWITHKAENKYIEEVPPPEWEFRASAHGSGTGKMSSQNIWLWRPVGLNCRNPTGLGAIIFFFPIFRDLAGVL